MRKETYFQWHIRIQWEREELLGDPFPQSKEKRRSEAQGIFNW